MGSEEQQDGQTLPAGEPTADEEDYIEWLRLKDAAMAQSNNEPVPEAGEEERAKDQSVVSFFPLSSRNPVIEDFDPEEVIVLPERAPRHRSEDQLEKARRRQELYLQKRREKKKRKVVYSRILGLLKAVTCLLMIVGLYFAVMSPYWQFSQNDFELHGNQLTNRAQLERFIQALDKKPIFLINPASLEKTIRAEVPLVDRVYIRRHLFPVGLDVTVTEKPSWGVLYTESPFDNVTLPGIPDASTSTAANIIAPATPKPMYLMHWDNTMSDLAPYHMDDKVLQELGNPIPIISPRTALKPQQVELYRKLALFLNSHSQQAKLQYLDTTNPQDITAQFDGFQVRFGRMDSTVFSRLARLFSVLPSVRAHQSDILYVDLRWNQQVLLKKMTPEQVAATKQQAEQRAKQQAQAEKLKADAAQAVPVVDVPLPVQAPVPASHQSVVQKLMEAAGPKLPVENSVKH